MGLFNEVKKPVIRAVLACGGEISPLRPLLVAKEPPCVSGCPNGTEVREILVMIAQAKERGLNAEQVFERAWNHIVERNPFPAVTGRICPHPCEVACNRSPKDGAVTFHAIERMIGDFGIARKLKLPRRNEEQRNEKIAVVGAGPAGLSCAYQLARRGYRVSIFESLSLPGGMLRYGVPGFRLQRDVLDAEIDRILDLGIKLKCNCRVGRDISLEQLRQEHHAVFVGTGAWQVIPLKLPGENAANVMSGLEFLQRVNGAKKIEVGSRFVVVGAGGSAIDVARASKRLGAEVTMVSAEITAADGEVDAVRKEGVRIEAPAVPVEILVQDGRAKGVRCAYLAPTAAKLPNSLENVSHVEFELNASSVIVATRREPYCRGFEAICGGGWFAIDDGGKTPVEGLFAGGDNTGLGSVARAIAQGRMAAESIDRQFRGIQLEKRAPLPTISSDKIKLDWYPVVTRQLAIGAEEDRLGIAPEVGWNESAIESEAKRCMSCGMCMDCETCWQCCSNNCFVRLPPGQHCKIKLELCNGCKKCADMCPAGYIELV